MGKRGRKVIDIIGKQFGRLIVLEKTSKKQGGNIIYKCKCTCKNETICYVQGNSLRNGHTKSCGCINEEKKHNMTKTKEHKCWVNMIQRCCNPNHPNYHHYGGRGVTVCDEWRISFINFYQDMGPAPAKEYSIERKDNEGNYNKENCEWIPMEKQHRNTRIVVMDIEKARNARKLYSEGFSIQEIADFYCVHNSTIRSVIKNLTWKEDD